MKKTIIALAVVLGLGVASVASVQPYTQPVASNYDPGTGGD